MSDINVPALKEKAMAHVVRGKWKAALKAYQELLAHQPDDLAVLQKTAEMLVKVGRASEAVDHFARLADAYGEQGHLLKAIAVCKAILQIAPTHQDTQERLASLYAARQGDRPGLFDNLSGAQLSQITMPVAPQGQERPRPPCVPLFSELERGAFMALVKGLDVRHVEEGGIIVREGEPGDCMYLITRGSCVVLREAAGGERQVLASMGEGGFFGEIALLARTPRLVSVEAEEECELLVLTREVYEGLVERYASIGEVVQRTFKMRLLADLQLASPLFRHFSREELPELSQHFRVRAFEEGTVLLQEGQRGRGFYILLRGRCEVMCQGGGGSLLREGDVFGEISLLSQGPCTATVRTATACVVLGLGREAFERLVLSKPALREMLVRLEQERLAATRVREDRGGFSALAV